jgi:hypothetical protein
LLVISYVFPDETKIALTWPWRFFWFFRYLTLNPNWIGEPLVAG